MKKMLSAVFALALATPALNAAELTTRLVEVGIPEAGDAQVAIMVEGEGRVLWANANDAALLSALTSAQVEGRTVRVDFNSADGTLNGVELLNESLVDEAPANSPEKNNFSASVLDMATAQTVFDEMDGATKWRSQCFNRAHGWAYDMHRKFDVSSQKVFIFFTSKYVKQYKYKWWFHVAPFVLVQDENMSIERVMDVTYMDVPPTMRDWTNYFMYNDAPCKSVNTYSEYRRNQQAEFCYLIRANMYYRSPRDLELLETEGREELGWNLSEIREARKQAFRNHRFYNP